MSSSNILLVDIGNTSTCVSVCNGKTMSGAVRVDTAQCSLKSVEKAIANASKGKHLSGGVLCSVVPMVNLLWNREIKKAAGINPILVSHRLNLGLKLEYPKPETIGADRLANVCGAVARYGTPVIIADFGTATTFDLVTANGSFAGGVITPGLHLMTSYMAEKTALLPKIKLDGVLNNIGKSTKQAMQIGAVIGYRGLVREITDYLIKRNKLGCIRLVATGGLAATALKGLNVAYHIDPHLTMWGIYRVFELNRK